MIKTILIVWGLVISIAILFSTTWLETIAYMNTLIAIVLLIINQDK